VITYPAIAIGIATSLIGYLTPDLMLARSLSDSLIGAAVGAGLLTALILAYWLVRRIEGMGWGDVKMMGMIGATLGFASIPAVLLLASVAGAAIGLPLALRHEKGMQVALPFGIFLGLATLGVLFFGPTLVALWFRLVLVR
jgi:leader peptidase (prepilin peptidase)/N-methyltransferase